MFSQNADAGLVVINQNDDTKTTADFFDKGNREITTEINTLIEQISHPGFDTNLFSTTKKFNSYFNSEKLKLKNIFRIDEDNPTLNIYVLLFTAINEKTKEKEKTNTWLNQLWKEIDFTYSKSEEPDLFFETVERVEAIIYSFSVEEKKFLFISGELERLMGLNKDELFENPLKAFRPIDLEEMKKVKTYLYSLMGGVKGKIELRIIDKHGNIRWIENSSVPVFKNGKVASIDGRIHDITNEYNNRLLLQRSEEKLRSIFETADDLIFILDENGNFVSVNTNGALLLEYTPSEMNGKHIMSFVPNTLKGKIAGSFSEILKKESAKKYEWTFISKYGKKVLLEMRVKPVYEKNSIVGIVGFGRDISYFEENRDKIDELNGKLIEANRLIALERDRARHKISVLEELNRLKNEFVSSISHELRTPLASIIGFAETIASDNDMPDSMRSEFNSIILTEAKRLANLINDVLDISKIERGSITLNKKKFDLIEVLNPVIQSFIKKANEKSLFFTYELPSEEVFIHGDKERIEQIFENVIDNAVKFNHEKGRIAVFARVMNKDVEIIVSDTGVGIPKKDLPFIFQKFYKVSRPGTETPGTGLGLSIVKQIVDLHKGFVTIISEEKQGTTVVIKLPKL